MIKLYKLNASPPSRAVMMLIDKLGIQDIQYIDIDTVNGQHLTEEYRSINPQHTIPTLNDEGFILWDSHAISGYLLNKYAEDSSLYPSDPKIRAVINQRLHFDSGVLFAPLRDIVRSIIIQNLNQVWPELKIKLRFGYKMMNTFLADSRWLAGDELTLADICCVATISSMNEVLKIDNSLFPNLSAWLARCSEYEFYKNCNEPGLADFRALVVNYFKYT